MDRSKKTYEGMFLLDAGQSNFETASEPILSVLQRSEAEILSIKPWDERRLAYEIAGRKQGLYVLTYFKADPKRLAEIEHDCELDERILRTLLLRRDHLTDQQINAETPATASSRRASRTAASEPAKPAEAEKAVEPEKTEKQEENTVQPAEAEASDDKQQMA
ncbi:MAG: 30S ribosomal protein S6 [Planctomycetota bacterium]|nr:30S ribosomal protein S6 [Planctomycetota bacterium]